MRQAVYAYENIAAVRKSPKLLQEDYRLAYGDASMCGAPTLEETVTQSGSTQRSCAAPCT